MNTQHSSRNPARALPKAWAVLPLALMMAACVEGNAQDKDPQTGDAKPKPVVSTITMDVNADGLADRVDLVFNNDIDVDLHIVLGRKGDQEGDTVPVIVKEAIAFHGNMAAQNATVEEGKNGVFLVKSLNEGISRSRWEKTLTVAFRKGEFVVAGLSYMERDTLDHSAGGTCDVNFLTGKAVRDGKAFRGANELISLKEWDPNFLPPACEF